MSQLIKCKKCGGPHITLKCGKEKQVLPAIVDKYQSYTPRQQTYDKRKITTVRISNLPNDMTVEELTDLVSEWGRFGRVNISNYENKSGFIDFHYRDEAEYFVGAIDRTPFDSLIIRADILDKN